MKTKWKQSGSGWNGSIEAKRAPLLSDFYLGWFYTTLEIRKQQRS
ncbi:hypothetical protein QPK24_18345 [Paenibacillus polygoni]|uniref:Uncharacterized protein n=1 Tax=Paenibacillus polygoni TaxID=3050112 RepID=A0ABY8X542_9BACL|nr:hypothetical protein [Paenibacillus polygoni]WIV18340.1 hypothetical protein QPK24_18345 [Paenibacillus polygoni]